MPSSGCFSYESNRQGPAEDRSEKRFFPFQPLRGRPVESQAAFSFRTFPNKISHLCLNVHQTFSDDLSSETPVLSTRLSGSRSERAHLPKPNISRSYAKHSQCTLELLSF